MVLTKPSFTILLAPVKNLLGVDRMPPATRATDARASKVFSTIRRFSSPTPSTPSRTTLSSNGQAATIRF
jgi:hypothetical protein